MFYIYAESMAMVQTLIDAYAEPIFYYSVILSPDNVIIPF